jgi:hypothetical protein
VLVNFNLAKTTRGLFIFQVSLTQARIDMSELDEDGDGFLQPQVTHIAAFHRGSISI